MGVLDSLPIKHGRSLVSHFLSSRGYQHFYLPIKKGIIITTEIKGYIDENFYKQFVLEIWRRNLITREQSAEIERELLGDDLDTHLTKLSKLVKLKLQEPRK